VVQANFLAATTDNRDAVARVYNIAVKEKTTLLDLYRMIRARLATSRCNVAELEPVFAPFRQGDIRYSMADISKAKQQLQYSPSHTVAQGLDEAIPWYVESLT